MPKLMQRSLLNPVRFVASRTITFVTPNLVRLMVAVSGLSALDCALAQTYTITDLGTLGTRGRFSAAYGINNRGQVVGIAGDGHSYNLKQFGGFDQHCIDGQITFERQRPFLWTPATPNGTTGTMVDLGTLGGPSGVAWSINEQGRIVGAVNTSTILYSIGLYDCHYEYYESHPFLWEPSQPNGAAGSMIDLTASGFGAFWLSGGTMPYPFSFWVTSVSARALNDAGQLVINNEPFLWQRGAVTNIGFAARAINSRGQVVGCCAVWQNGATKDLGTLPADTSSEATGIENGQVIGVGRGSYPLHAFMFLIDDAGTVISRQSLGPMPGSTNGSLQPTDVNNNGQVIGVYPQPTGYLSSGAFLWDTNYGLSDLDSLLPANSGWHLFSANAINDKGQIVGAGVNAAAQIRALLLTPIVPTAPRLTAVTNMPGGQFRFTLLGEAGGSYTIQASSNLVNWIALTNVVSTTGTNQFTDPAAPNFNRRFYRAVTP